MMKLTKTIFLATAAVAFVACSNHDAGEAKQTSAQPATSTADVKNLMSSFADAWNKKDSAGLASMIADDALLISGRETMKGKKQIADHWIHHNMPLASNLTLTDLQTDTGSDLADATGTWSVEVTPPGKAAITSTGNHTFVWKKQADGSWKLELLNMEDHDPEPKK